MSKLEPGDSPLFFDLVVKVRAMRRLMTDPVALALVRKILQVGVQAASAQNTQPWRFLVIVSEAQRRWIGERYRSTIYSTLGSRLDLEDGDDSPGAQEVPTVLH